MDMSVEFKNYYDILGVTSTASDAEIKKAYRNLARQHHPDVAKDKRDGGSRFKEINEANEVQSDPEKRRKYDELGANWNRPGPQPAQSRAGGFPGDAEDGSEFHFAGTGFSDFFEQFFGGRGHSADGFGRMRQEAFDAEEPELAQNGQDVEADILVTLDEVLRGSERTIRQQRLDPRTGVTTNQTLRVKIPAGVRASQLIRVAGKGRAGRNGGAAGNLYLRVAFASHPEFRVQGIDLYHDLELAPWEAVLGATVRIPTLDGLVSLKIPPGTVADRDFRLRGMGLPAAAGARGDLHAIVSVQVPSALTPEQKGLWEQLAATATFAPRKTL